MTKNATKSNAQKSTAKKARKGVPALERQVLATGIRMTLLSAHRFLKEAATLYRAQGHASSVVLATSSIEEVGRFNILNWAYYKIVNGLPVDAEKFATDFSNHVPKLLAANGYAQVQDPVLEKQLEAISSADDIFPIVDAYMANPKSERDLERAKFTHQSRMKAQYVAYDDLASCWVDPSSDVSGIDALNAVSDAFVRFINAATEVQQAGLREALGEDGITFPEDAFVNAFEMKTTLPHRYIVRNTMLYAQGQIDNHSFAYLSNNAKS